MYRTHIQVSDNSPLEQSVDDEVPPSKNRLDHLLEKMSSNSCLSVVEKARYIREIVSISSDESALTSGTA